jgi:hypothetical protein
MAKDHVLQHLGHMEALNGLQRTMLYMCGAGQGLQRVRMVQHLGRR